jgi:hypothetical protein
MSQETEDATVFSTDLMAALRSEIVESEKARIDLLKYKLIAIAALGSIGLGLGGGQSNNGAPLIHATYILNIIPLVCLYVDLLCHHNTMRILVIGQFLKAKGCDYENFISDVGNTLSNIGLYLYRKRKSGSRVKFEEIGRRYSGKYVPLWLMYDANASAPETSTEKKNKAFSSGIGYFFELEDWALQWSTIFVSLLMCIIALCKIYPVSVSIRDMKLFDPYFILGYAGILGIILSLSSYKYFDKHRKALFAATRMLDEEKSVRGLKDYIIHNQSLSNLIQDSYRLQDVKNIYDLLNRKKTFHFPVLETGLFPAADLKESARYTGYAYVWVCDNIYVAYAHYLNGYTEIALKTAKTLARYFISHKWRFEGVISKISDPNDPMNRPHIRFRGEDLSEIDEKWAHAQNDALGYFLWLFCKIHNEMGVAVSSQEKGLLALFALYFEAICYWKDQDSAHWEETRKVSASSIGVVVGGLTELRILLQIMGAEELCCEQGSVNENLLDALISKGRNRMTQILPAESIQSDLGKNRRFDAALLFLIFPMSVVSEEMAAQILYDVTHYFRGDKTTGSGPHS